jgi:acyl-homoserine-lactone acylase
VYPKHLTLALILAGSICASPALAQAQKAPAYRGEVLVDTYGVPHVYGKDEASMFYGFGYATVKNHGNLVLKLYAQARGRAAEYFGASEVRSDKWAIANGVYERAAAWYKLQPPKFRADLDAFAAGMNAYGKEHPEKLDPAARAVLPISGVDVVAHAHRMFNYLYVAPERRTMEANDADGSNAWAVAPKKSASGNSMLLANPHLAWEPAYTTYFEMDLNAPGFHAYGATQVGLPVLRFMFNDRMGFTNTVNSIVGSTNYELTLSPDGKGYMFDGKAMPFKTATKSLKIKQADGSLKTETFETRESVHGPVFTNSAGKTMALRVAGLDRPFGLLQYWDMGKSKSFAEYETIMKRLQVPSFNIVYADKEGHIQYLYNGVLPKHPTGDRNYWAGNLPGDTSATLWSEKDMHTYADMPKVNDPATGYVQNTNDPPWVSTYPQAIQYKDYPKYMYNEGPVSLRGQLSNQLMGGPDKLSFDEFVKRKLDTHVLMADRVMDDLIAAASGDSDPEVQQAVQLFKDWNRKNDADSKAALLFETWAGKFAGSNFANDANYRVRWSADAPITTPTGIKDPAQALTMLKAAIVDAKAKYGRIDRPFGEVSQFNAGGGGKLSLPGNGGFGNTGVFRVITWGPMKNGVRVPQHGETWVSLVEFSTPIKAVGAMSYGSSSQPDSPHRDDQLKFLQTKTLRTLWYTRAEVEKNLEEKIAF